jgi:hypothetical protein
MAYSRQCCKKDGELSLTWSEFSVLPVYYVPAMWRQVKVVLIPKPGRNSHSGPRDFTPISLISFLLKTMERLVNRYLYLRDESLALVTLHPNQHAYKAGKSVETARGTS